MFGHAFLSWVENVLRFRVRRSPWRSSSLAEVATCNSRVSEPPPAGELATVAGWPWWPPDRVTELRALISRMLRE